MGPWHFRGGGGQPALLQQKRVRAHAEGGLAARRGAARPKAPQSRQAEPENAQNRQVGGAENADPCRALELRLAANQPPIGLWPALGLATIRALTQDAANIPRSFSKVGPWLYPREKPRA